MAKSGQTRPGFLPQSRTAIMPSANDIGRAMIGGYKDFPKPDLFK